MLSDKTILGYKNKNQGVSSSKIIELELEAKNFENSCEIPKWMIYQDDMESEMLSLGWSFLDKIINMVEIMEIYDNLTYKIVFYWYGNDEFEIVELETPDSSSSYFW